MRVSFIESKKVLGVLKNKHFLGLWISQFFSQVSTHMVNFALIIKIFSLTGSSTAISLLVFWFAAPAVLMGVLAGVYVDRWDRKRILILINFIQAVLVLGYFFAGDILFLIYPIVFVYAALNQFFIPSQSAMIPTIIKKEKLLSANSFFLFTNYASFVLGYALAGPLIIFLGSNSPFFIASFLLFLATLAVLFLPSDHKRALSFRVSTVKTHLFENIKKGLSFIKETKKVSYSIMHLLLVQIVIAVIIALGPSFAASSLNISVESISFILIAPAGIGAILGALVLNRTKNRFSLTKLVKFGVIFASFSLILLTVLHKIGPFIKNDLLLPNGFYVFKYINLLFTVSFLVFLLGFFAAFIVVPSQTMLQRETSSNLRGRVFGMAGMLINVTALIPLVFFGFLADAFSASVVLGGIGVFILIWGVFFESRAEQRVLC